MSNAGSSIQTGFAIPSGLLTIRRRRRGALVQTSLDVLAQLLDARRRLARARLEDHKLASVAADIPSLEPEDLGILVVEAIDVQCYRLPALAVRPPERS